MSLNDSQLEELQFYVNSTPVPMDAYGPGYEQLVHDYAKQLYYGPESGDHSALYPVYRNASAGMILAAPLDGPMVQMKVNR